MEPPAAPATLVTVTCINPPLHVKLVLPLLLLPLLLLLQLLLLRRRHLPLRPPLQHTLEDLPLLPINTLPVRLFGRLPYGVPLQQLRTTLVVPRLRAAHRRPPLTAGSAATTATGAAQPRLLRLRQRLLRVVVLAPQNLPRQQRPLNLVHPLLLVRERERLRRLRLRRRSGRGGRRGGPLASGTRQASLSSAPLAAAAVLVVRVRRPDVHAARRRRGAGRCRRCCLRRSGSGGDGPTHRRVPPRRCPCLGSIRIPLVAPPTLLPPAPPAMAATRQHLRSVHALAPPPPAAPVLALLRRRGDGRGGSVRVPLPRRLRRRYRWSGGGGGCRRRSGDGCVVDDGRQVVLVVACGGCGSGGRHRLQGTPGGKLAGDGGCLADVREGVQLGVGALAGQGFDGELGDGSGDLRVVVARTSVHVLHEAKHLFLDERAVVAAAAAASTRRRRHCVAAQPR
eukprot:Rhum_TRINITY_DN1510_c0_g1::Rhum_TRINITY_DN1510_c0_g1_i1::g.4377::m.4377